ncbi:unnamed protein product [Rotaria magnacalcarata]|uniref:Uncharacterized protein n=1 Tax=Rotaria magnacalcarata TaxID=392030 RepID=A0A815RPT6_9BILA|nr:unnamed protein product [Rotaria magnacalcarata]
MSKQSLTRTCSLRKRVRPMADIYEEDDSQRRDLSGRKRVDVVHCLLDSSSDEVDNDHLDIRKPTNILWLTFNEICHIRYVLVQTSLTTDKQYTDIHDGRICFQCRKTINIFSFLSFILRSNNHQRCFICKQAICKRCSQYNFIPPSSKLSIPIRIQNLIKLSSRTTNESNNEKITKPNAQTKTLCYDCLQIFNEHVHTSQPRRKPSISPLRRTNSLPPLSSKNFAEHQHTRHRRRRPVQVANSKFEKATITTTSPLTDL